MEFSNIKEERIALLKSYLKRLGEGEDLEAVRQDFVKNFKNVDASEIMKAEQSMLAEGTPITEVQKLCDIHSALFHGVTREERAARTKELTAVDGHPLQLFIGENERLEAAVLQAKQALQDGRADKKNLEAIRELAIHYAKKGDLLYPLLKVRYAISGPSDVMWTVDDEIRDEIARLFKSSVVDGAWKSRFAAVLVRVEEMIYKEANILFPNCAANFSEEEWIGIYHDQKDYAECFGVKAKVWEKAEKDREAGKSKKPEEDKRAGEGKKAGKISAREQEVVLAGGSMTVEELTALLNTLPFEITFVDVDNINRFFNEGPKDFKRPRMAIGREVFSCHPPKIEEKVRYIIHEFRTGTLDEVPVWIEKNGKCLLVKYMAVRDRDQKYVGTLELVQNMDFAKEHFMAQRRNQGE